MNRLFRYLASALLAGVLSVGLAAQTTSAGRYDQSIQARAGQQLAQKTEFRGVQAAAEDGIITLTGSVDLYQQKLDAAKRVRKLANVQGVRNLITVNGAVVSDAALASQLGRKLYYDRIGYDNLFNYVTASVQDGVVTLDGVTMSYPARDSAEDLVNRMPGVKDVVSNISVAPASNFDDRIRLQAARVIYRDPVLSRYAMDPARPIRIVVENGHLTLYGTVENKMDKDVAGIRARQVFGVFSVQNDLQVAKS
ncbi:MAG TPA: BON domain-containing protein [Terriglobales bacterium]|nr:BON domain-containing protein [Terriglobales bacterium]